jgi:hypothetical protein
MAKTDERETAPHLLVVIDHQEARVYRTESPRSCPREYCPLRPARVQKAFAFRP